MSYIIDSTMGLEDKERADGKPIELKARLVARGFQQIKGIYFDISICSSGKMEMATNTS